MRTVRELEFSTEVPASVDEVFAWHERPGAMQRLLPPWQPVYAVREAASLRDGVAVLGMPAGLRWQAAHRPDGFDPPHQFVDELDGGTPSRAVSWRHTHRFEPTEAGTRVVDRLDTNVPRRVLQSMFAYRHRQLADDLAALKRSGGLETVPPLTVAVTGSGGMVGHAVCSLLGTAGHRVIRLVRGSADSDSQRHWDPQAPDDALLEGVDAVVHLAGAPIAGRFTDAHKDAIRTSRVEPTRRLAEVAARSRNGPAVFVSASAIGYYGADRGDTELDEDGEPGEGFLADVVRAWESATGPAAQAGVRVVQVRTGIVQSPRGGTLQLLRPLFSAGLGGRLGDGDQWQSWIGLQDLADIYLRAIVDDALVGPVNAVAPRPVRNTAYTRILARVLHRPALLPVPDLGPRVLLGEEGARELALANQRVVPRRLQELGHIFRYSDLEPVLRHVLGAVPAT